jgi:hypothetical protein
VRSGVNAARRAYLISETRSVTASSRVRRIAYFRLLRGCLTVSTNKSDQEERSIPVDGMSDSVIDLSDIDTADVSWLAEDGAGLYSLAPGRGVALAQHNGRNGGSGAGCWTSRPATPWGPFCH